MDKSYLIQLTVILYRLTLLFPKKEPLRYKSRELANDILEGLIPCLEKINGAEKPLKYSVKENFTELDSKLELLDCFFEIAKELFSYYQITPDR